MLSQELMGMNSEENVNTRTYVIINGKILVTRYHVDENYNLLKKLHNHLRVINLNDSVI